MPRKPRVHVEGAFYHVLARGNHKQQIFHNDEDYLTYLRLVQKYSKRYDVELHGYVLMPNHIHLLIRVSTIPLSSFMQGIQQSYTQIYNKQYEKVGHIFQGRFKSLYVDNDVYLLELIRYIHLNPVKAGLVEDPREYRWSSQRHYFNPGVGTWVKLGFIIGLLAEYGGTVIDDYQLVPEAISMEIEISEIQQPEDNTGTYNISLEGLLTEVAGLTGVNPNAIAGPSRSKEVVTARDLFVYSACRLNRMLLKEVAGFLNRTEAAISKSLQRAEKKGSGLS